MNFKSPENRAGAGLACLLLLCSQSGQSTPVHGQEISLAQGPSKQAGVYRITLRLPADGLAAGEEQQIEIRIVDTSNEDRAPGALPLIRALVRATFSMSEMPMMPQVSETAHPEGAPGDYGVHPTFAHGGDYLMTLNVAPPKGESFTVEFPIKVVDRITDRRPRPNPYKIEIKTEPAKIKNGEPVKLRLVVWFNREIRDADGVPSGRRRREQVKSFETIHEKQMHLIIMRSDMGFFEHVHPEMQSDGSFVLSGFAFPTAGEYRLFADVAPRDAGAQILPASLKVEGGAKNIGVRLDSGDRSLERELAGVRVSIAENKSLPAKKTTLFAVTLTRSEDGSPVSDLEPYLGAMGHLMMIHEEAQTLVHAHPDLREADRSGQGRLVFLVRPPRPGLYRAWIEFQRRGKLNRTDFIVEAKEDDGADR